MPAHRRSVVIADDHPMVREMVERVLDVEFDVVASVPDGQALVEAVDTHSPDVAVVDIRMPVMSGIEAIRRLVQSGCSTTLIVLTVSAEAELVEEAVKAGARGLVTKSRLSTDLVHAIAEAHAGRQFVSPP